MCLFFFFSEKKKLGIRCELSDNSHQMPSFIFSEKIRIMYATLMLTVLRVKHCKLAFKH